MRPIKSLKHKFFAKDVAPESACFPSYINENGKRYASVFYHNVEYGYFTPSNAEYLTGSSKYSYLRNIGSEHKFNGMYEFKLEYPELKRSILWEQEKRPQDATNDNLGKVNIIRNDFSNDPVDNKLKFYGLRRSDHTSDTYIDGQTTWWHYAIGQYQKWADGILAGPKGDNYLSIKVVKLWMRVPEPTPSPSPSPTRSATSQATPTPTNQPTCSQSMTPKVTHRNIPKYQYLRKYLVFIEIHLWCCRLFEF